MKYGIGRMVSASRKELSPGQEVVGMKRMVVGVLVVALLLVVVGTTAGAASSPTMAQFKDL
jgi:hypothetical protein